MIGRKEGLISLSCAHCLHRGLNPGEIGCTVYWHSRKPGEVAIRTCIQMCINVRPRTVAFGSDALTGQLPPKNHRGIFEGLSVDAQCRSAHE